MRQKTVDFIKLKIAIKLEKCQQQITIKNIKDTEGLLDTDFFHSIMYEESEADIFNAPGEFQVPYIRCLREREESDEEYLVRMRENEAIKKYKENEEKETYLRLKAKFDNNEG